VREEEEEVIDRSQRFVFFSGLARFVDFQSRNKKMAFKADSSKSTGVKKLRALFPGGGWSEAPTVGQPDAVMLDSLQGLIGFSEGTGRDCAMRVSYLPREYLEKGCSTVIMCFDRQERVPMAKAAEQAMRADRVRKTLEAHAAIEQPASFVSFRDVPAPGIWMDKRVPDDFAEGLQDREGYRREVIRFLCKQWIGSADQRVRLQPGAGTKIVLSGHCIRQDDLPELVDPEDWPSLGLRAGDDPEDLPIVIEADTYNFDPGLGHEIGEGESQFFHFVERLNPEHSLLISTDSDVLFHAFAYFSVRGIGRQIDWRYDGRQPKRLFCNLNELARHVKEAKIHVPALARAKRKGADYSGVARRWSAYPQPLMQIVAAQALAGTDYTQGFLMVTHDAVFEALFLASDKIGPLVLNPAKRELDAGAYVRLLVASWIQARLPGIEIAPTKLPNDPIAARDAWRTHAVIAWEQSQSFTERNRFPHPIIDANFILNRVLRWAYYLDMQMQLGTNRFSLDAPANWGYGPLDGSMDRDNIYPLLDEEPQLVE
jgi:hypothetical protein